MPSRRTFLAGAASVLTATTVLRAHAATSLDLSTTWPDGNFHTQNARAYAAAVAEATGGNLAINVHSGGSLGFKGPEYLEAVEDGLVPMADVNAVAQVGVEPLLGIEVLPFLIGSQEDHKAMLKFLRPKFEEIAARHNQKILYMVPWPEQFFYVKNKVSTLEDLRAVSIRVNEQGSQDMCERLGMAPIQMPWGDVVPALSSGRISAVSTSAASGVDGRFWEFMTTIYGTRHGPNSQLVTINLDTFDKLPADQQEALTSVATKMEPGFWAISAEVTKNALAKLTGEGMILVEMTPEDRAKVLELTKPIIESYMTRVPDAESIIKSYYSEIGRG